MKKDFLKKYAFRIWTTLTILCALGWILSYVIPHKVLDTYTVNMSEEEEDEETTIQLSGAEDEIGYAMTTTVGVMKGIQVGIDTAGADLSGATLVYRVYRMEDAAMAAALADYTLETVDTACLTLLVEKSYDLGSILDGQYVYLPFKNKQCEGNLYITFTYVAGDATAAAPAIYANHSVIDALTFVEGEVTDLELKGYYVYSHDTYPAMYDFRVMVWVCAAAMACAWPGRKRDGETDTVCDTVSEGVALDGAADTVYGTASEDNEDEKLASQEGSVK